MLPLSLLQRLVGRLAGPARAEAVAAVGPRPPASGAIWVELHADQPHPIDLRWVDELIDDLRQHVMVRPEDELLILVPNTPHKLNGTAVRILHALVHERLTIRAVLEREGDSTRRRRELHYFFSDLMDLLEGRLGEGAGRRAVVQEPFSAKFCEYPVLSEVALTYRCNASCAFCYAGCSLTGLPDGWSEDRTMSDEQVCRVLEIIRRDAKCPSVSFTGGEPTLRRGLPRFIAHAKGQGMKVNLISNGQKLSDRLVSELVGAGLDSAQLSLEGPNAAVHDGLVGRAGAFDRLWAGLERLRSRGIRVHTNTTVSLQNLQHLEPLIDLVADRGLERMTMNLCIPCGTAAAGGPDLHVPYSQIGSHINRLRDRAEARGVRFIWYSPIPACLFNTVREGLGNQGCAAADGLLHVNPAGDVLPCSSFRHDESLGNLLEQPFEEVWRSPAACFFRDKQMMPSSCSGCSRGAFCQGACTLYWREVGLGELGAPAAEPPAPQGW